jgi:hypothetical protein
MHLKILLVNGWLSSPPCYALLDLRDGCVPSTPVIASHFQHCTVMKNHTLQAEHLTRRTMPRMHGENHLVYGKTWILASPDIGFISEKGWVFLREYGCLENWPSDLHNIKNISTVARISTTLILERKNFTRRNLHLFQPPRAD